MKLTVVPMVLADDTTGPMAVNRHALSHVLRADETSCILVFVNGQEYLVAEAFETLVPRLMESKKKDVPIPGVVPLSDFKGS
jgi:uncharacterized protein YlzI (FlbEa/FlbD family)